MLFDGVCHLCSSSVQFILKRDRRGIFRFASLQSEVGQSLLRHSGLPADQLDSFVLVENNKVYTRSAGALRVCRKLDGAWPLLSFFRIIPRPLRDAVYNWIARRRYRWFGKNDSCWLPSPEWKSRFLE
ncbi:thiol-disulfide oxidoreductase DCC family protein [Flavitalea sp. BT771]|uniref:thiol-disulfide oxidoreductase DCC family protein n=1 Tax=Flavitalea sp. BT771 TaxID=3063329 RepID=UPI0026E274C7|nr:thiol-disulfide oxidoreductase DCC family protein [Flavitalea sp. BT771]MDO6429792.1 thiol-disulfide oxidoreductase DCC family protein [Flavitalea sp. BT771]MDV6218080.1 thiol-disulfide oxidoreductase DCC family protein [Flavitalea sp. BT771]